MDPMIVRSRIGDYQAAFRDDSDWVAELAGTENAFVVVDELVWRLHGRGCLAPLAACPLHPVPATEEAKTLEGVAALCDAMIAQAAKRNATVVSIGGGVIQDVTGFLASVIYRGVRWVYVPSTLLAQADSCIGAKTSLNFRHFKNLLGTMYPPQQIFVHTPLLRTLNDDQFFSGLGEIVKLHIAAGPGAMAHIEPRLTALCDRDEDAVAVAVRASLLIKQGFIERDEFDRGDRRLLNFGHCFGHAVESATDFGVPHGQAVVFGMVLAGLVARDRGLLAPDRFDEVTIRLLRPALPDPAALVGLDHDAVVAAMRHDKKRTGAGLALVMPVEDWRLILVDDLGEGEALQALGALPFALPPGPANRA